MSNPSNRVPSAKPEDRQGASGSVEPKAVDEFLPLDHKSFRNNRQIQIRLKGGSVITGSRDARFGWMDARGVKLPGGSVPEAWMP